MTRRLLCSLLVLSLFLISMTWVPTINPYTSDMQQNVTNDSLIRDEQQDDIFAPKEEHLENRNSFFVSEEGPYDGILNPVTIEQVGYTSSGTIAARTDDGTNTGYSLPLDDIHSWEGSQVDLDVTKLSKLFALNGSFTEGTISGETFYPNGSPDYFPYGWGAISATDRVDPDVIQRVAYEDTGREYIVVETKAELTNNPQHQYTHYNETTVYWNQSIDINPGTSDFILSFDYLYLFGPINGSGPDSYPGSVYIEVIIDGNLTYSLNLADLTTRNSWSSTGQIPVSLTPTQNPTMFMIGIKVNKTFVLDADLDYDNTLGPDGTSNAEYITVYFDDVSFTAATSPSFEEVDLQLTVEGQNTPVVGSNGIGSATISESGYWTVDPIDIQLTSNTTVSFEYEAILRTHRFSNSTWMTDNTKFGVQYTVVVGESPELSFNTYIGFIGGYINLTTRAWFPSDWENVTVFDPFLVDVTSSCDISANMVEIPTSLMDRLGWWRFNLDSPNYAKSIKSQIFDSEWTEANVFRIGNTTRVNITIGTDAEILGSLTDVNVIWFNPSDQAWKIDSISGGALGQIYSNTLIFNSSSPAGEWWVEVHWTNGTEVAYDRASFFVSHSSKLVAEPSEIKANTGSIIKGIVKYTDGDTNAFLMDSSATLVGNWSGSMVSFNPNPIQNWWEADFDTSLIGAGQFNIVVRASRLYYDNASCIISVISINVTRLISPNAPWTAAERGNLVNLTFKYEVYNSTTDTWNHVNNNTDVSVGINWSLGYWSVSEDSDLGIYTITLNSTIVESGTYLLNVTFTKPYHESKILLLTLILSPMTSSLIVFDGLADRVDLEEPKTIKMGYIDKNGDPVQSANIIVNSISPPSGLDLTSIDPVSGEDGNFTVTMTPFSATVFTVRFVATGINVEPASTVFVLVVNDVSTNLEIFGSSTVEIGLTETYIATIRYELFNGTGVDNAAISIVYSGPTGKLSSIPSELAFGNYSAEFSASLPGTYVITIIAFKPFHQRASNSFSLIFRNIPTNLTLSVGKSDDMGLTDTHEMTVRYQMDNGTGIEGADVKVFDSGTPSAIDAIVIPLGFGNYSIQFTATLSGPYLVTITASKQYFQAASDSFLLTVREITANLVSLNGTGAIIGYGKDYRLFVSYTNDSGHGLVGANVSVVDANPGITWSSTQVEAPGIYSLLLTPLSSNSFSITVRAELVNHQIRDLFFTLTVTAIPTTLAALNVSTSISVDRNFTVYLHYQDEDTNLLENASLGMLNPPSEIEFSPFEELGGGIYRITLTPLTTGIFDMVFSASKDGYQTDYASFTISATIIKTNLSIVSGLSSSSITYLEEYEIHILYKRTDTGNNVTQATIRVETPSSDLAWSWSEDVEGGYSIILNPQRSGNWTFTIYANRTNYEERQTQFRLEVNRIPILVEFVSDLTAREDTTFNVTIRLIESMTNNTVEENATVQYRFSDTRTGQFQKMYKTSTPGVYTVAITVLLYASSIYRVEIDVDMENYKLIVSPDVAFYITEDWTKRNTLTITASSGFGVSLVVFFVALRIYSGRKRKQLDVDLANKRRFDDADNIIGVIVLHKKSGIPIYSKIPKGGFDEGIVAAFVSAITHFREEFEMFDEEQMQVLPISDIIRAVQTRSLICAFVTVKSASLDQNRRMEGYGMQVGTYLDDIFEDRPSSLVDNRINEMLEYIFDTTLDGHLLKYYKIATDKEFPKRYRFLEELMTSIDTRHCSKPVYLAQGVSTYGVPQARGCTLVLEAIDKGLIKICEEHEIQTTEKEFKDFFKGSAGRAKT
ncbi:MAG: hypothetical protein ACFFCX_09570 [Candidatus Sifarchaeia archaeon]